MKVLFIVKIEQRYYKYYLRLSCTCLQFVAVFLWSRASRSFLNSVIVIVRVNGRRYRKTSSPES